MGPIRSAMVRVVGLLGVAAAVLWLLAASSSAATATPDDARGAVGAYDGSAGASVSAGDAHTCGVRTDGTAACWGSDDDGRSTPPAGTFTQVSAGAFHTCGVRTDGTAACWGSDGLGQSTPVALAPGSPLISTVASPGGMVGIPVRDVATLAGGSSPTGTVTFRLFSDDACTTEVFTSTNVLDGLTATSGWFSPAAPGTYHWTALYNGDAANNAVASPCLAPNESVTITAFVPPAFTQTISGDHLGPVTVAAGQSLLIGTGARVVGPVTVAPGGALTVVGARISRGIVADNPAFLSICGSDVAGPPPSPGQALAVSNAAVPVRVGDPAAGCAGNRFAGHVSLTSGLATTFGANVVSHTATFTGGGPGATVVKANTVFGTLACTGHDPAPTNAGQPNTAGAKTGQCTGL